jgi:HD-GYP domain-containing protein (c-di-GMP phosphodiesterase class II)
LTSSQPYRAAWPVKRALGWHRSRTGQHFDPAVVFAFEALLLIALAQSPPSVKWYYPSGIIP